MGKIMLIVFALLFILWLLGLLNARRAIAGFLVWSSMLAISCIASIAYVYTHHANDPLWDIFEIGWCVACVIAIPMGGPIVALIFGIEPEVSPNPPVKQAYVTYRALPDEDRAKICVIAGILGCIAAGYLADRMRRQGNQDTARVLSNISKRKLG